MSIPLHDNSDNIVIVHNKSAKRTLVSLRDGEFDTVKVEESIKGPREVSDNDSNILSVSIRAHDASKVDIDDVIKSHATGEPDRASLSDSIKAFESNKMDVDDDPVKEAEESTV